MLTALFSSRSITKPQFAVLVHLCSYQAVTNAASQVGFVLVLSSGGNVGDIGRYRRIGVKQLAQVVVEEHALGVEGSADASEIVPARVERGQFRGGLRVHLAPVWSPLVAFEDLFDMLEIGLVGHTTVHMHGNVGRFALVGWAEPDIIGMYKTALQGEVNLKLIAFDTVLYLGYDRARVLSRDVILHLLEAHPARCRVEEMTIIDLVNVSNGLC